MHAATAEGLRLIALLQIVNEQLTSWQQMEFAICENKKIDNYSKMT